MRQLRRRGVRTRLTTVYTALSIATGTAMLVMVYNLVRAATEVKGVAVSITVPGFAFGESPPIEVIEDQLRQEAEKQQSTMLNALLLNSAVALAVAVILSVVLGWIVAGRILRPLREITGTVRDISATNLHERLTLAGPDDELKELGDTFDALLARLDAAFEAQRRFIANASHELRSPLARQRAIGQLAITDPDATVESLCAAHERVLAAGAQQERMIDALLALARGQAGPAGQQPVDLAEIVRDAVLTRSTSAAGLEVITALSPATVIGDPSLLDRLVANLVDNAILYNRTAGMVEVTTRTSGTGAELRVSNTGPHIPAAAIDRLLEPFTRLPDDRTHHDTGTGLGLCVVKAIADAHDGYLRVRPRDTGGLEVLITFPLASTRPGRAARTTE